MQEVPKKTYGELLRPFMDADPLREAEAQLQFDKLVEYILETNSISEVQEAEYQACADISTYADGYFLPGDVGRRIVWGMFKKRRHSFSPATNDKNDPPPTDPFQRFALISLEDD